MEKRQVLRTAFATMQAGPQRFNAYLNSVEMFLDHDDWMSLLHDAVSLKYVLRKNWKKIISSIISRGRITKHEISKIVINERKQGFDGRTAFSRILKRM